MRKGFPERPSFNKFHYFHRVRIYYIILLLLMAVSCTLSADQEKSLNEAQRAYVDARNEADVLKYVGYTHPNVIAHYKHLADSSFQKKFDLSEDPYTIQDGTIREIKTDNNSIHVAYLFKTIEKGSYGEFGEDRIIVAISEDSGKTWFFLEKADYLNNNILPKEHQLIDLNE